MSPAKNVLLDQTTYNLRSNADSVFLGLLHRYGDTLWSRTWFGQFRELVTKCADRNIERALDGSTR